MESHKKINILILGGTKFIGKALVNAMEKKYFRIDVLSKKKYANKNINKLYHIDLKDFEKLDIKKKYDYIFDFISKDTSVLKKILKKINFNKYIFISSVWLAKINRNLKLDRSIKKILLNKELPNITKKYLLNKYKLENFLVNASNKNNKKLCILRLPIILGNNDVTERLDFYTKRALDSYGQIILKDKRIDLNLLYVEDFCTAIIKLIKNKKWGDNKFLEGLNFSNISYENFLKTISIQLGVKQTNFFYLNRQSVKKKIKNYFNYNPFLNEVPLNITKNNIFKLTNCKPRSFEKYIKNIKLNINFDKLIDNPRINEINFLSKLKNQKC
jgi:nucleoside-diphosphate-sugar epimerase